VKGVRITSIIVVAALLSLAVWAVASGHARSATTADSSAPGNPAAAAEPVSPPGIAQRWSLLGGDKCEWVIRNTGEAAGSRGLSIECDANPDQQLVLQVDAKVQTGGWTLRVDDGEQEPNWLPLSGYPASRVAGSKRYRFLIYSDDPGSAVSIKDVSIHPAADADDSLPLVWPTSGPVVEKDLLRRSTRWRAFFGLGDSDSAIAQAEKIASWVHRHSRVVGIADPRHVSLGSPHYWTANPTSSIDGDCGTYTSAMLEALSNCGIDGRAVSLGTQRFEQGASLGDTHALVEVFDKAQSRWLLVDPTFNVVFEGEDGRVLGIAELITLNRNGGNWETRQISACLPGRSIKEYYLPMTELLWMADAPAVPGLGSSGVAFRSRDLTVNEVIRTKYHAPRTP
jgi:transglutaminase-like putative cysteine protease